jgi:hypothetical protein
MSNATKAIRSDKQIIGSYTLATGETVLIPEGGAANHSYRRAGQLLGLLRTMSCAGFSDLSEDVKSDLLSLGCSLAEEIQCLVDVIADESMVKTIERSAIVSKIAK